MTTGKETESKEIQSPWDYPAEALLPRFKVLVPGAFACSMLTMLGAYLDGTNDLHVQLLPLAGPLSALWLPGNFSLSGTVVCSGILLLAILAHPIWPSPATAAITIMGLVMWLIVGFCILGVGV